MKARGKAIETTREAYEDYLYNNQLKINLQRRKIALALVTFVGAWCNRMVAKQEDSYSTVPADEQMNKDTPNHPPDYTLTS